MTAKRRAIATLDKKSLLEVGRAFDLEVKTQMSDVNRPYRHQATEGMRPDETCDRLQPVPAEYGWSRSDSAT